MCVLFHNLYIHTCMICYIYRNCQLCVIEISILIDLTTFPYEYTVLPVLKLCIIFDSRLLYFYCGILLACKLLIHLCKYRLIRLNMILNKKSPRKLLSNRKSLALHSFKTKESKLYPIQTLKNTLHIGYYFYIFISCYFSVVTHFIYWHVVIRTFHHCQ